jgi:UDP-N-acetylglucosamine transferase subunit ALG13
MSPARPLLFVTVGTDPHPFDRLVGWVDRWLADHDDVDAMIQHSASRPPTRGKAVAFLPPDEMQEFVDRATVVICHAGTIVSECRRLGVVPVVVPRLRRMGEAVDDHQISFARRFAAQGIVVCCETESELRRELTFRITEGGSRRQTNSPNDVFQQPPGVERAARALERLVAVPRRRQSWVGTRSQVDAESGARVLFIGGAGRSGSTLFERMLGEIPGVQAAGELAHIWQRGVVNDERCSCGARFSRCEFWNAVGSAAFGGWRGADVDRMLSLRRRLDRTRTVSRLAGASLSPRLAAAVQDYDDGYLRLYRAIARIAGASVVVDSSKLASLAFSLDWAARIDLRVVHMIRDSRAVAYSCSQLVPRPEVTGSQAFMPRYRPPKAALLWDTSNALFDLLAARGAPTTVAHYERLARDPAGVLARVTRFAGIEVAPGALSFVEHGQATLSSGHSVAGNPMRFLVGDIPIEEDIRWRSAMPIQARRTVTALTYPMLRRYGYVGADTSRCDGENEI